MGTFHGLTVCSNPLNPQAPHHHRTLPLTPFHPHHSGTCRQLRKWSEPGGMPLGACAINCLCVMLFPPGRCHFCSTKAPMGLSSQGWQYSWSAWSLSNAGERTHLYSPRLSALARNVCRTFQAARAARTPSLSTFPLNSNKLRVRITWNQGNRRLHLDHNRFAVLQRRCMPLPSLTTLEGDAPCAVPALCEKSAVLHHR